MLEKVLTGTKILSLDTLSAGTMDKVILYLAGTNARVAVITDRRPFPERDGMIEGLKAVRDVTWLDKVRPNPEVSDIMDMCGILEDKGIDVVVGIGGGSTMDSAKAVMAILGNGGNLEEYLGPEATRKITEKKVKLILVPTTVGTGSEVTKVGVYTSLSGRKYTLGSPLLQADIALLVAGYVRTLPKPLIASTGFDALSHSLETIWNKNATSQTDSAAAESAFRIMSNIEKAYDGDGKALFEMQQAACMAGIAFSITGTSMVHALSFILSEEWHVPHGTACAFTLEDAFDINMCDARTRRIVAGVARRLFGDGDDDRMMAAFRSEMIRLKHKFGLPCTFKDLGVELRGSEIESLFVKAMDDPKMKNNVIPMTFDVICGLLEHKR